MTGPDFDQREDPVEYLAREIQLRGMTVPAVMFLEASRPYRPLGSLFFAKPKPPPSDYEPWQPT